MGKRILCIGDSNTWGYIPGSGERYEKNVRWAGKLAQILGENYEVIEEGMTVRALEELVQTMNEPIEKVKKLKKIQPKPAYIVESEERLMDKFGTSVQITPKGERGKIEIEYLSQKDLTRILDVLEIELDD